MEGGTEEGREGGKERLPSARARMASMVRCLLPSLSIRPWSDPSRVSKSYVCIQAFSSIIILSSMKHVFVHSFPSFSPDLFIH